MNTRDIVVIGGSAGALEPLGATLADLPPRLPAMVFVVLHRPAYTRLELCELLAKRSALPVKTAVDGALPPPGTVYVAPADCHLVLRQDRVVLTRSPRENQWRPAIDVLFRSAAVAFGARVAGVILSGALDDGTAGLSAIKRCGGVGIVQAPSDAAYPEMPASAIRNTKVDHVVPAREIATMIRRVIEEPAGTQNPIPPELILETSIAETGRTSVDMQNQWGELTPFTCTDCGGPLWKREEDGLRYRCLTGHALSSRVLEKGLGQNLDAALWAAIRQFEQRANLQASLADREEKLGRRYVSSNYRERATEARSHAIELRKLLQATVTESSELAEA